MYIPNSFDDETPGFMTASQGSRCPSSFFKFNILSNPLFLKVTASGKRDRIGQQHVSVTTRKLHIGTIWKRGDVSSVVRAEVMRTVDDESFVLEMAKRRRIVDWQESKS